MSLRPDIQSLRERVRTHGAVIPEQLFEGVLLKGKDAIDLLHRLSTNDLRPIQQGVPISTVFTNEKGRIIDHVEVILLQDRVVLIAHAGAAGSVISWLDRFIITEDVEVTSLTSLYTIVSILIDSVNSSNDVDAMAGEMRARSGPDNIVSWDGSFGPFVLRRYLMTPEGKPGLMDVLDRAGVVLLDGSEYEALRIAAGIPSYPEELNEAHNPLESGLRSSVSFTKGCYIGQEVIARLDSYSKVQRELVILAATTGGAPVPAGTPIQASERVVGMVTSVGGSLGETGETMLLGYVEKGTASAEGSLTVRTGDGAMPVRILGLSGGVLWTGSALA